MTVTVTINGRQVTVPENSTILEAARHLIDHNRIRTQKKLFTQADEGVPIVVYEAYSEDDEAHYVVETISDLVGKHLQILKIN